MLTQCLVKASLYQTYGRSCVRDCVAQLSVTVQCDHLHAGTTYIQPYLVNDGLQVEATLQVLLNGILLQGVVRDHIVLTTSVASSCRRTTTQQPE